MTGPDGTTKIWHVTVVVLKVDADDLMASIADTNRLLLYTGTGTTEGQIPENEYNALKDIVDDATILDVPNVTQSVIDLQEQKLLDAMAKFEDAIVPSNR